MVLIVRQTRRRRHGGCEEQKADPPLRTSSLPFVVATEVAGLKPSQGPMRSAHPELGVVPLTPRGDSGTTAIAWDLPDWTAEGDFALIGKEPVGRVQTPSKEGPHINQTR